MRSKGRFIRMPARERALCAALCVALGAALCAVSCAPKKGAESSASPAAPNAGASDHRVVIGFSIATDTFILERWNKDIKIFTGAARDLGADVIVQLSAGGTKEQISQINFLLDRDIDVLVVIAHDTDMLSGVVRKAKDAKIPVVAYDRLIMGVPIDAYVSFNNREVGRLFGKALSQAVPSGNYLIVNGSKRDNNSFEVYTGLHEIIDASVESGKVTVVDELWLDEWSSDEALMRIGKVLDRTTDIDAISCANDQIAGAAIQLLSEYRLAGKVAVVGQDADIGACQKVVEGTQLMTVYKPIAKLANSAAGIAVALARGMRVPTELTVDNKSGSPIPFYIQEPQPVFRDTMDMTVIRDGFHSREDVYRNFPGPVK